MTGGPDSPGGWERAHPQVREQLHQAETALAAAVDERAGHSQPPQGGLDRQAARRELLWLRAERDRLRQQLRGYPHQPAREAEQADRRAGQADRDAQSARERAQQAEGEYAQLGRLARRGQRGTQAQERQQRFEDQAERYVQSAVSQRTRAREVRERPGGPAEWDRAHPGVRDRLAVYEHAYEVAETQQAWWAVQVATGRDPAVRVLGPRPQHLDNRRVWEQAALAIGVYRLAYDITDENTVLGPEPDRAGRGGFTQHADWENAARLALQARGRLGISDQPQGRGPVSEQARRVPELTPPQPGRGIDRSPGFGR